MASERYLLLISIASTKKKAQTDCIHLSRRVELLSENQKMLFRLHLVMKPELNSTANQVYKKLLVVVKVGVQDLQRAFSRAAENSEAVQQVNYKTV